MVLLDSVLSTAQPSNTSAPCAEILQGETRGARHAGQVTHLDIGGNVVHVPCRLRQADLHGPHNASCASPCGPARDGGGLANRSALVLFGLSYLESYRLGRHSTSHGVDFRASTRNYRRRLFRLLQPLSVDVFFSTSDSPLAAELVRHFCPKAYSFVHVRASSREVNFRLGRRDQLDGIRKR